MTDAFSATTTTDPVAELVGEGKKFSTVADLAKGKLEADAFVEQLKREAAELRKELSARVDTEAALTELRNEMKAIKESKPSNQSSGNTTPALSESDLKTLITKTVTEAEASRSTAQNIVSANNRLVEHYGSLEKAQEAMRAKSQDLGLSIDRLKSIAAESPTAFLKIILPESATKSDSSFNQGSTNTASLLAQQVGTPKEGTKEYFDAIRAKSPKLYFSPEVQNRIYKAAMAGTYDHTAGLDRG